MALTVNNMNQVTTPAFTYDAAGNVTWDTTHALRYDAEGRMTPTTGTTYTYDGDGRRVQKSDGTLYWVDDSLRPLSVGTTSGSITRDYIFLGEKRIAFVPLSSGNPYYYLSDHLGSTAVIASGDGKTIQWEADYFPFGAVRQVFTNIVGNNYEFTGYENDSETGYNYAVARFDSGRWGRFMSPDPYMGSMDVSNPQSLNRYEYVSNNPINASDPIGLAPQSINCPEDIFGHCVVSDGQGGSMSCNANGSAIPCDAVPGLISGGAAVPCPEFGCSGVIAHDTGDGITSVYQRSFTNELQLNCDSYTGYTDYRNHCQWSNISLEWIADWDVPLSGFATDALFPKDRPGLWQQSAKTGEYLFAGTVAIPIIFIGAAEGPAVALNGFTYIYYVLPATPFLADRVLDWAYRMGTPGLFGAALRFGKHEFTGHW
jgi:RHS repeat-associated protein